MFNFRFIKVPPSTYLLQYRNGRLKRQGTGLAFWYFAPTTSLVAVPLASTDLPFMVRETTSDYQEVTVQGQLVYRIADPEKLATLMNFTLKPGSDAYVSDDPEKLRQRIAGLVQVELRREIERLTLLQVLAASQSLAAAVQQALQQSEVFSALGLALMDLAILAIKPIPETARALEAKVREQLLQDADEAIYRRRNASIEQERAVKENELNTELAVEAKQRQLKEAQLAAQRALQEQQQKMQQEEVAAQIDLEQQREALVQRQVANEKQQADARAYAVSASMQAVAQVDLRVLETLSQAKLTPEQLIAQALKALANNAQRIGQLNIAPDLLQSLTRSAQR